jgi:hypothetical protein
MRLALPRWFLNLPLARKLTVLATATSAVAVMLVSAVLGWYDITRMRAALVTDTAILVDTLGASNTATLSFDDARGATDTLKGAAVNPEIQVAAVVKPNGAVFARYDRNNTSGARPSPIAITPEAARGGRPNHAFTDSRLVMTRPIRLEGEVIGMMYVELDLDAMEERLAAYRHALAAALLGTVTLAMLIGWRLQKAISQPLLHLTQVTRAVARDRAYELSATPMANDEVGELARSFNDMLAHIRERDAKLESHRQELEQTVDQRTAELQASVQRYRLIVESTNVLIGQYRQLQTSVADGTPDQEAVAIVSKTVNDIDLDYLLEHMPAAFERSLEGLKRVAVIVRSMKEFARPDQKEMSVTRSSSSAG